MFQERFANCVRVNAKVIADFRERLALAIELDGSRDVAFTKRAVSRGRAGTLEFSAHGLAVDPERACEGVRRLTRPVAIDDLGALRYRQPCLLLRDRSDGTIGHTITASTRENTFESGGDVWVGIPSHHLH
jgi:hypothetical protein